MKNLKIFTNNIEEEAKNKNTIISLLIRKKLFENRNEE